MGGRAIATAPDPGKGRASSAGQPVPHWALGEYQPRALRVIGSVTIAFLLIGVALHLLKAEPRVVLDVKSHAVLFIADDGWDLVRAATPRHGLEPGGTPFAGIRFTPRLPNDETLGAFMAVPASGGAAWPFVHSIQRLKVTGGCVVRLEHYVDKVIRLDVEARTMAPPGGRRALAPSAAEGCHFSADVVVTDSGTADLTLADDSGRVELTEIGQWTVETISHPVAVGAPATLVFQPAHPLHLRQIRVSELRFESSDTGHVRSAILSAIVELPDVGDAGDDAHTAHVGDAITLGRLENATIAEMLVGDTIRTVFRGKATRPVIAGRDVRPTLLMVAAHTSWVRIVALVVTALSLAIAILKALARDEK